MRKIAIVSVRKEDVDNGDYAPTIDFIANSITEWTEVSESRYCKIREGIGYLKDRERMYWLIEMPKQKETIATTVEAYEEVMEDHRKSMELYEKKAKEEKAKKEERKRLKILEEERKVFEILKKKFQGEETK